jgi:sugar/nucleoside kinase (ribokinase family)
VATAVLALAHLGLRVAYAGAVGDDAPAEAALAPLRRAGVDCTAVRRVAGGRTRSALIQVARSSGERAVFPERDPRVALSPGQPDRSRIASARVLHLDAEDLDAALWAVRVANEAGVAVVLDADRPQPGLEALFERVDFPIVSRALAESLSEGSAREGLRVLAARARRLAVVTLGPDGALAQARDGAGVLESPGFRVEARDTTGAGDAFHAGFIWALLEGRGVETVLRTANAAGAMNCRALGAQGGLASREALLAFLGARAGR